MNLHLLFWFILKPGNYQLRIAPLFHHCLSSNSLVNAIQYDLIDLPISVFAGLINLRFGESTKLSL